MMVQRDDVAERKLFHGRRALLIEDNAFMRQLVRSLLRQFGFTAIEEAADGAVALTGLVETAYDVIVCDWMMEPVDGYHFVRSLRRHPRPAVRSLPVIMLTAVASREKIEAARDVGVTEYLLKPVPASKLRSRLVAVFTAPREFVSTPTYTGPDRRRRADPSFQGPDRRLTDRIARQVASINAESDFVDAEIGENGEISPEQYGVVLDADLDRMALLISEIETAVRDEDETWSRVQRLAHDIKGQAPGFRYIVAGDIAASLDRMLRASRDTPSGFAKAGERRLQSARAHLKALRLVREQRIFIRSRETDALVHRLGLMVERVLREMLDQAG
jgi:two-component system chemotaxis response regulator CheY